MKKRQETAGNTSPAPAQPRFSIGWPPGFESTLCPPGQPSAIASGRSEAISAAQSRNRTKRKAAGRDPQEPKL